MSSWRLPTRLEVGGKAYPIHSDYRDILDILHRLNDASEPEFIRWRVALALFYEGDLPRSDYPEAMQKLADFLNCGQTLPRSPAPPLLDWEQDAPLIAADINKAAASWLPCCGCAASCTTAKNCSRGNRTTTAKTKP